MASGSEKSEELSGASQRAEQEEKVRINTLCIKEPDLVDAAASKIVDELIGDRDTALVKRSYYSTEHIARLGAVVKSAMTDGRPIPVLIACAACKLPIHGRDLDSAELVFMKGIVDLQRRVRVYHEPGLEVVIRFADLTLAALFPAITNLFASVRLYMRSFQELITLGVPCASFVTLECESHLVSTFTFFQEVHKHEGTFLDLVKIVEHESEGELSAASRKQLETALETVGWSGGISASGCRQMRQQFVRRYANLSAEEHTELLARYFACSLSRRRLGCSGTKPSWNNNFIDLSLVPPLCDAPVVLHRVYRRSSPFTVSKKCAEPFWRSVGVMRLNPKTEDQRWAIVDKDDKILRHPQAKDAQFIYDSLEEVSVPVALDPLQ